MDLVREDQQQRLAALERVVGAPAVERPDIRGELIGSGLLLTLLLASVGALLAVVLGALWLLG